MKMYFSKKRCESCGADYDPTRQDCPNCKTRNADLSISNRFMHDVHVDWYFNLIFLLIGFIGLYIISLIVSIFVALALGTTDLANSIEYNGYTNFIAYIVLFVCLCTMLYLSKGHLEFFKSFKNWKTYVFGLLGALALLGFSVLWSSFVSLVSPGTGTSTNQSMVSQITVAYPALSIIVFGFIGPICEEITYRIGLFGLAKRVSRVIAYLTVAIVFGLIHFDFTCFGSGLDAINREFLNLPDYMVAGLVLALLYDYVGIGASTFAHVLNNLYGVLAIIILHYTQAA